MSVSADHILDRIRLKQQIVKWRSLAILLILLVGVLLTSTWSDNKMVGLPEDYIARVDIDGMIVEDLHRDEILKSLKTDKHAKALLLYIDSPGGTIVGGEMLYNAVEAFRKQKKPVVAVMGGMATSGGYMAAVAADRIYAHNGTLTGSIGVLIQSAEVTELAKKIGITLQTFKSGPLKATPSPFEKLTPEAKDVIDASIQDAYNLFVEMVAAHRTELTIEQVRRLADGRVYTGRQALKEKLIDAIGGEDEAIEWLKKEKSIAQGAKVRKIEVKKPTKNFQELLGTVFHGTLPSSLFEKKEGLVAVWSPELM
ncbi:MAG: cytidylate kinase [Rickettsiales bacterium]|jgi:protease-4|nr:cytidylate kinase [Rickettsiales bacterium]